MKSNNNKKPCIWEWEQGPELQTWLRQTLQEAVTKAVSEISSSSESGGSTANSNIPMTTTQPVVETWMHNVVTAVQALRLVKQQQQQAPAPEEEEEEDEPPPAKRARLKKKKLREKLELQDPYHVWWISKYNQKPVPQTDGLDDNIEAADEGGEELDLPLNLGGRLAQLSPGAWFNALAAVLEGVVKKAHPSLEVALGSAGSTAALVVPPQHAAVAALTHPGNNKIDANNSPTNYARLLYHVAVLVHRTCQRAVQSDIWRTTPQRIQELLAADLTAQEFAAIRKRIYETVVLGKGLHAGEVDEDTAHLAVEPRVAEHDVEKNKKCPNCGNLDQSAFALDRKNGDIICSNCGVVVSESLMHEGSAYRKFEGEVDRNHHGDAPNSLYSVAHNLSTTLSGVAPGSGIDGYKGGRGAGGGLETILRNTHAFTELNLSQYGKTDRRTRVGYKDRQKKEAFVQMTHAGDALHLHEAVVQRAKELFAGFRDDRELVQQFKGVLAACLCEAFEQLAQQDSKGHLVTGVGGRSASEHQQQQANNKAAAAVDDQEKEPEEEKPLSKRAARRNELHHATLAGRGGLLLDFNNVRSATAAQAGGAADGVAAAANGNNPAAAAAGGQSKPAAKWDLEDCRSWLLGASRRIAQSWVDERLKAVNKAAAEKIPKGTLEELEGKLVEHSISLCEHLEQELQARNNKMGGAAANQKKKNRVVTPRVQDMSKLGIRWQHAHERGSGGKGGVGGSGTAKRKAAAVAAGGGGGRTAGQILLLKTAQKLGSILKDQQAGAAIHRELRAVIGKQETQKRQKMLEEASRQRFLQMKRKPWLQARASLET